MSVHWVRFDLCFDAVDMATESASGLQDLAEVIPRVCFMREGRR